MFKKSPQLHALTAVTGGLLALCATTAHASGFYIQEQSVSALGTAYAGGTTAATDASTIYTNPAGIALLEGKNLTISGDLIAPTTDFTDEGSTLLGAPVGGSDSDDPIDPIVTPNLYASMPVYDDKLYAGLGISAPFGLSSNFERDWYGRYDSVDAELTTINVQPTLAYRFNPWLSAGGGIDIQYAKAKLTNAVYDGQEGFSVLEGDDISLGWNAGLLITPHENTKIGIHYRAAIDHDIDGDVTVTGTATSDEKSGATAGLNLPDIISAGIAQQIHERLALYGQVSWYGWENFENITVIRDNGTQAKKIDENFENTVNFAAGLSYQYNPRLTLRAGYQYDPTPTNDEFRHASIPDQDRHWFTAGSSYKLSDTYTIDMGAAYIIMDDANIDVLRNNDLARIRIRKESSEIGILSLGVSARF